MKRRESIARISGELPVPFVWGLTDDVFPGAWGRRWHERIPHSTWDAFEDAGHFVQDTHGDRVVRAVLRRRISASRACRFRGATIWAVL